MRRKEKEITSREQIAEVINACQVCRIGLAKDNKPYIVPVSFGFDGRAIYFHTAKNDGMKIEYIAANNQVCFEFEHSVEIVSHDDRPCNWSFTFQTVIGFGQVEELESDEEKVEGLQHVMAQYSGKKWDFTGVALTSVSVWKITIESMTGKQSLNFVEK